MNWENFFESYDQLGFPGVLYMGGALLALVFLLVLLLRRQPKTIPAYSTENGQVMVSRSAIVELVQTSCIQIEEVSKPQVSVRVKGGKTHFDVRLKLASGGLIREIEATLQAHMRKALTENLGIEDLGRINIIATGFKSGRIEQSSIKKKEKEALEIKEPIEDEPITDEFSLEELPTEDTPEENKPL